MAEARRAAPDFDITRSWNLPDVPPAPGDESLADYLGRLGFTADQLTYTRRMYANAAGEDPRYLSAAAAREEWADTSAGEGDFRILDGYDRLIHHLAGGLDVRLNTAVEAVEYGDRGARVYTTGGVFEADQVVVTLPLGVLQAGSVRFDPELPPDKRAAIAGLRMGPALKLIYRFDEPPLPPGIIGLYSAGIPPMWWAASSGHETRQPVMTAFATGRYARDLLMLGEAGALALGLETLCAECERIDLDPLEARLVNWVEDPCARGGYSAAPPGQAGARAMLAQPVGGRLFWAGEATAPNPQAATVHGAYASGRRAAREILALA